MWTNNTKPESFVCVYASSTLPFIAVSNCFSRFLNYCFLLFRSLFESTSTVYKRVQLNYFVFEKYVIERTSKTNTRTVRLCVRFKYTLFYRRFQSFQSLFGSLFEYILIDYKTLELNYFAFEAFLSAAFFGWHPCISHPQGHFDFFSLIALWYFYVWPSLKNIPFILWAFVQQSAAFKNFI